MGLIERLVGTQQPKIGVHAFQASLGEWEAGAATRAQVIIDLGISAGEEAELDAIFGKMIPVIESHSVGSHLVLTGIGTTYDNVAVTKGLGFVAMDGTGVTGVEFRPRFNKVGTGTLSFQLWNETSGTELCVADDAVVGDNKAPIVSFTAGAPPAPGTHVLRVRAKNSTASQLPVYYGASVRVRRANALWYAVLHNVLLRAENGFPITDPVSDHPALVRARLGI